MTSKQLAQAWLAKAQGDLNAATTLLQNQSSNDPWTAAFHLQQAVEKALKAVLVAHQIGFGKLHDLSVAQGLLPVGAKSKAIRGLSALDPFAVATRYPGVDEDPAWPDVQQYQALAKRVLAAATADVAATP